MRQLSVWYSSQVFIITSNESSGVRTCTVSSVCAQARATAARAARAPSAWPKRRMRSRAWASSSPWPSSSTIRRVSPGARVSGTCSAAHGIEAGAEALDQRVVLQGRRGRQGAVAAEEARAVAGRGPHRLAGRGKRHAGAGVLGVGVAGEHRAGLRVVAR